MKSGLRLFVLAATAAIPSLTFAVPPIPEPGVIMYGNARSIANNQQLLPITAAAFQISSPDGTVVSLNGASNPPVRVVVVNNISFYVVRIPFTTGAIGAIPFDTATNSFDLKATSPEYTRQASINGKTATFAIAAQNKFQLSATDRGRFEQVDFLIDEAPIGTDYASFAALYFQNPNAAEAQSGADPDGDGMNNGQEFAAGTDPVDPLSALKTILVEPLANGGFRLVWKSVAGKVYKVEKSTDAQLQTWAQVGSDVTASGPTAEFTDTAAQSDTVAHYRIRITK